MRSSLASVLLAAACARPVAGPGPTSPSAAPAPNSPGAAPPGYTAAYTRSCGEIVPPFLSPDEATLYACRGRFDARTGRYLGTTHHALGAQRDGALFVSFYADGQNGLGIEEADGTMRVRAPAGAAWRIAVSPDGARLASLEEATGTAGRIVLRDARTLAVAAICGLGGRWFASDLPFGFSRDGRLLAARPADLHASFTGFSACGADGRWAPVLETSFARAAIAPDGSAAALADGSDVRIIELPGGAVLGHIVAPGPVTAVGLARGARALAVNAQDVSIYRGDGRGHYEPAYRDPALFASILTFDASADTLFAVHGDIHVLRRQRPAPALPTPTYRPALPGGFKSGVFRDGTLVFPSWRGTEFAREIGEVAAFANAHRSALVRVTVTDAAEFGPGGDWSERVLERHEPNSTISELSGVERDEFRLQTWRADDGGRALEYRYLVREGCGNLDRYVRIMERGDALVKIVLETQPGEAPERVRAWLKAFVDAPLGASPSRVVTRTTRVDHCSS